MGKKSFTAEELAHYLIRADALQTLDDDERRRDTESSIVAELGETQIGLRHAYQAAEQYGVYRAHFDRAIDLYDLSPEDQRMDLEMQGAEPTRSALGSIYSQKLLQELQRHYPLERFLVKVEGDIELDFTKVESEKKKLFGGKKLITYPLSNFSIGHITRKTINASFFDPMFLKACGDAILELNRTYGLRYTYKPKYHYNPEQN